MLVLAQALASFAHVTRDGGFDMQHKGELTQGNLGMTDAEMAHLMSDDDDDQQVQQEADGLNADTLSTDVGGVADGENQEPKPHEIKASPAATKNVEEEPKPKGDVRAALRAARRGEERAKTELVRLRAENEKLLAALPAKQAEADDESLSPEHLEAIEQDFPALGKTIRTLNERVKAASVAVKNAESKAAPQSSQAADFEPPYMPPEVQDDVDATPDLLSWQYDPDQTKFEAAKAEDRKLMLMPSWKDRPQVERFAEVVRRINSDFSPISSTSKPLPKPAIDKTAVALEAVRNAKQATPRSLGELSIGGEDVTSEENLNRFAGMSDADIEAELLR